MVFVCLFLTLQNLKKKRNGTFSGRGHHTVSWQQACDCTSSRSFCFKVLAVNLSVCSFSLTTIPVGVFTAHPWSVNALLNPLGYARHPQRNVGWVKCLTRRVVTALLHLAMKAPRRAGPPGLCWTLVSRDASLSLCQQTLKIPDKNHTRTPRQNLITSATSSEASENANIRNTYC